MARTPSVQRVPRFMTYLLMGLGLLLAAILFVRGTLPLMIGTRAEAIVDHVPSDKGRWKTVTVSVLNADGTVSPGRMEIRRRDLPKAGDRIAVVTSFTGIVLAVEGLGALLESLVPVAAMLAMAGLGAFLEFARKPTRPR